MSFPGILLSVFLTFHATLSCLPGCLPSTSAQEEIGLDCAISNRIGSDCAMNTLLTAIDFSDTDDTSQSTMNASDSDDTVQTATDASGLEDTAQTATDVSNSDDTTQTTADPSDSNAINSDTSDVLSLSAPSAVLMEASTGTIIYEKNAHEALRPASVTKIMTLLLIFEALENGQLSLTDVVTVSENAASMGGSQVYLEAEEEQTVEDMIKCISIASANDACVAMAEYVAGSEDAFVQKMNDKAAELGMEDTHFVNCCGLDADGHLTSAYDIALMARELTTKHPAIFDYCQIWMDSITHHTSKGDSRFDLTNTNKLLRYYSYATGLKTGYTSSSKYCLAATATRDNVDLIAVLMAEETIANRNSDAVALLDYGFANCRIYEDANTDLLENVSVNGGMESSVPVAYDSAFSYVLLDGSGTDSVTKTFDLPEELEAPVRQGDTVGYAVYYKDGAEIGKVAILAAADLGSLTVKECILRCAGLFFSF